MSNEEQVYPAKKLQQVKEIEELALQYKVIGLTNLEGVSSSVLQNIRKALRGQTEIKMAKNTLKRIALTQASKERPELQSLIEEVNGNCAFIFSDQNPFTLQRYFNANRIAVAAKPGQLSSEDVWISAGVTDMSPGPVIGELNSIGLRTSVEAGKIKINQDTKVLSAGEEVTEIHASIFSKLDIKPVKVGIALHLAMEETGEILYGTDLTVDEEAILGELMNAYVAAFNLSMSTGYPTRATIMPLLGLAHSYAMNLSVEAAIPTKDSIGLLLAKAMGQAQALQNLQN